MIVKKTVNRNYPKPDEDNYLQDDVKTIETALDMIDQDIHALNQAPGIGTENIADNAVTEQKLAAEVTVKLNQSLVLPTDGVLYVKDGNVGIGTDDPGLDKLDVRGSCYSSGGWNTTNADYAEYFESHNGKAIPPGTSVSVTKDGKIIKTKKGETPIGIISARPAIVGNLNKEWPKKYLTDDFGVPLMETYKEKDTETGKTVTKTRRKLNPDYDPTRTYIARNSDDRPEWNCVGLLGQLPLIKGQPTAPSWVKLKNISAKVELWLVK